MDNDIAALELAFRAFAASIMQDIAAKRGEEPEDFIADEQELWTETVAARPIPPGTDPDKVRAGALAIIGRVISDARKMAGLE